MAKKIKGDDIIEDNHLDNAIKSGNELLDVYKALDAQLVKTAKDMSKVSGKGSSKTAKGIQELNKAVSDSTEKKKAAMMIDKQKASLDVKLRALNSDKIQQNAELQVQISAQNKANKQLAREKLGLVGAYEKESKQLIKLRKELKDIIIAEGTGAKKTKELAKQVNKLDKKLKDADAAAGQFGRNVGDYPKLFKKAFSSVKEFIGALGVVGGIQLFTKVVTSSFNTIKDFGQSIANLSAITGATGDDLEFLKQKAIDLGKTTTLSASQVAEGFKIIASAKPELLEDAEALALVTEKSILLAEAAGIELPEAAAAVTNSLNQFGAGADQTAAFVDVLAAGAKFGSGDINFLNEALTKSGVVASNANLSFTETASALELLAETGVPASIAGTNLKGVILQLQKAGVGFTSGQFDFNDALDETNTLLAGIKDPAERAAKEIQLFGSQNLAAGQTFLQNSDRLAELNKNLGETGVAAEQAKVNNDTLEGSLKLLASAWEGYILGADGAGGITDKLKGIVSFLAENLETILGTIGKVVKAFVTYKVVTFAVTKGLKLYNIVQNLATKGMKNFSKASKLNPFGAIAAALVIVVPLIWDFVDGLLNAEDASNLLERVTEKTNAKLDEEKLALEEVGKALSETTAGSEERLKIINETNEKYGTTLENLEDETEFVKQLGAAYDDLVKSLEERLRVEVSQAIFGDLLKEKAKLDLFLAKSQRDLEAGDFTQRSIVEIGEAQEKLKDIEDQIAILKAEGIDFTGGEAVTPPTICEPGFHLENGVCVADKKTTKGGGQALKDERKDIENLNRAKIELLKTEAEIIRQRQSVELTGAQQIAQDAIQEQIDAEKRRRDAEEKARLERLAALKKMRDDSLAIIKQITDDLASEIDKRIEKRKEGISEKEAEVTRLQGLAAQGNTDAAEAIKAEKIAIAREKVEVERLEKRKKNLLISVAGLERASQLIGSGNGNPFATAGGEIKDFLSNLKSLSTGTDYNIEQTLGRAQRGGTDGHLMWADGREKLLSIKNSEKLTGMHQDEVTRRALAYNNDFVSGSALSVTALKQMSDVNIVRKLDSVVAAVKNMEFPTSSTDPKTGKETVRQGNKTTVYHHNPDTFRV